MGKVGHKTLIVLILSSAFATMGLMPSSNKNQTYQIILDDALQLPNTSIIKPNAPVTFNNVIVGSVAQIKFSPSNPRQLSLLLSINNQTPITQGTRANLNKLPKIYLVDQGDNPKPLKQHQGEPYLTIALNKSTITQSKSKVAVNSDQTALQEISASLKHQNELFDNLFSDDNTESIKQLLYSLQQISGVLSANKERINHMLIATDDMIGEVKPFILTTKQSVQMLNTQALPQIYTTLTQVNESLDLLRELLVDLNQNPSLLLRGKRTPKLGPGEVVSYSRSKPHCRRNHRQGECR